MLQVGRDNDRAAAQQRCQQQAAWAAHDLRQREWQARGQLQPGQYCIAGDALKHEWQVGLSQTSAAGGLTGAQTKPLVAMSSLCKQSICQANKLCCCEFASGYSTLNEAGSSLQSRWQHRCYNLLGYVIWPLLFMHLWRKSLHNADYRQRWRERLALAAQRQHWRTGGVLIHAVSVGELNAARPVIEHLLQQHPDCPITITTTHANRLGTGLGLVCRALPAQLSAV